MLREPFIFVHSVTYNPTLGITHKNVLNYDADVHTSQSGLR